MTVALLAFEPGATASGGGIGGIAGRVFYDAQLVDTEVAGTAVDDLSTGVLGRPWLYRAVPAVALSVAGYAVGRLAGGPNATWGTTARAGATVVAGYFPLVVGVAAVGGPLSIAPSLPAAVLLAGVVFPVGFGALGGAIAGGRGSTEARSH